MGQFNATASIIATAIIVFLLIVLYQRKNEDEKLLWLKLLGYYILGSLVFSLKGIPVPFGLIVGFIVFRPRVNAKIKRYAAILGAVMIFLGRILPL